MKSKSVVTSTVGYMCLGVVIWMNNMAAAGWFGSVSAHATALVYPLAIILAVMGILAYLSDSTLDAVIFFVGTAYMMSQHYMAGAAMDPSGVVGWSGLVWAVVICYIWLGSFKAGTPRMLFLLAGWLSFLSAAIGAWTAVHFFDVLAGYLGLVAGVLALIVSANAIACDKSAADSAAPSA